SAAGPGQTAEGGLNVQPGRSVDYRELTRTDSQCHRVLTSCGRQCSSIIWNCVVKHRRTTSWIITQEENEVFTVD
ncbi:hypothetical protein INR49_023627, partial [Caranx melampygus]